MDLLRSYPAFYLIKNDPLESQKVKATRAIEAFLKVRFFAQPHAFFWG